MKAGDKVRLNIDNILKICITVPYWYDTKIYTIIEITDEIDDHGNSIVKLYENINNDNPNENTKITSFYLTSINDERKEKLEKINNMSISIIKDNSIIYPIDVYLKYNNYLISEYENFLKNTIREVVALGVKKIINELNQLIEDNTLDDTNTASSIQKMLNVTEWEDKLVEYYVILREPIKLRNGTDLLSIERFLRLEKLKRLKSL